MKHFIVILVCMLFLIGCQEAEIEASYNLEGFEEKSEEVAEISSDDYFVHDAVMPNYVNLMRYPSEAVIDWNERTSIDIKEGEILAFYFESLEYLKAFEIKSSEISTLKLTFSEGTEKIIKLSKKQEIIELIDNIYASSLTIEIIDGEGSLSEFHIISEMKVDQLTYETYLKHDLIINEIMLKYHWQVNLNLNVQLAENVIKDYGNTYLDSLAKTVDLKRLKLNSEELRGYPILLNGQVVEVIQEELYYKVLVDTHVVDEPVVVYTTEPSEKGKRFMMSALFVGRDELLIFYGIK